MGIAVATLALIAAGCNRDQPPEGQVVAVINGEELTTAELNEEARLRSLSIGTDRSAREQLVQELIDRKLLVQAAKQQGMDKSPQHLLAVRRITELTLAQQLLAASGDAAAPTGEQIETLIKTHPKAFAERFIVSVDRISIDGPVQPNIAKALYSAASVDQIANITSQAGLSPSRATETWDSATLPNNLAQRLAGLAPGALFALVQPTGTVAGQVLSISPQPVPENQRMEVARAMLEQQAGRTRLEALVNRLRPTARIIVQPEFAREVASTK